MASGFIIRGSKDPGSIDLKTILQLSRVIDNGELKLNATIEDLRGVAKAFSQEYLAATLERLHYLKELGVDDKVLDATRLLMGETIRSVTGEEIKHSRPIKGFKMFSEGRNHRATDDSKKKAEDILEEANLGNTAEEKASWIKQAYVWLSATNEDLANRWFGSSREGIYKWEETVFGVGGAGNPLEGMLGKVVDYYSPENLRKLGSELPSGTPLDPAIGMLRKGKDYYSPENLRNLEEGVVGLLPLEYGPGEFRGGANLGRSRDKRGSNLASGGSVNIRRRK